MTQISSRLVPSPIARLCRAGILVVASVAAFGGAATLKQVTGFGNNPSGIGMYVYVPDKVATHPPILVGLHWCHGTAQAFWSGTGFAGLADKYGFIVIYPNAHSSDSCWDVHSTAALTHDGGSDPSGIVSMVRYAVKTYGADSTRVYVTGHSSGGMMTNVMLGSYPDIFKAGAAFAGVPFSCFAGTSTWNGSCASGSITKTGAAWGDAVRAAYPGYTGPRPRVQLWHGTTDAILNFANFGEEIKEWTNVLGVSATPTTTENNTPQTSWIRTRYENSTGTVLVEAIQETGQPHNLQIVADKAVTFFGLDAAPSALDGGLARRSSDAPRLEVGLGSRPQNWRLELSSDPVEVRFEIRDLDGSLRTTWVARRTGDGSYHAVDAGASVDRFRGTGIHLVCARVDGRVVASSRWIRTNPN
jgi:acetylxylan esterase